MKVDFAPLAQADLMDIAIFIAQDNAKRALTFVDELEAACQSLGLSPGIGIARPELGDGLCMLPYGRHLIFYRQVGKALRIERILHGDRDIGTDDF